MSTDEPIDRLTDSVSDGRSIDWEAAESSVRTDDERDQVRGLRKLERIAEYHRSQQREFVAAPAPEGAGADPRLSAGAPRTETWGHLTILDLASSGANGDVWRAWDAWLQREVGLKFLQAWSGPAPGTASNSPLVEEARALARVRHPGVLSVYGIAEHDGRLGMWMEFLHGGTLAAELARNGALPPRQVARIGLELCRALEAVHAAGLVHRDIKPANIVLEETGRVVLADFGLGRRWEVVEMDALRSSGTPFFMAPELLAGEPATPSSDLYALGVSLRWALTGHPSFEARTLEELKQEATAGPTTSLGSEKPDAPRRLVAAIERAMSPRPESRYSGAAQLATELISVLEHLDSPARVKSRIGIAATLIALLGAATITLPRLLQWQVHPRPLSFIVSAPPGRVLEANPMNSAISPDGRLLVMAILDSTGTQKLWLRRLDSVVSQPLDGTDGGFDPFWSPDSRHVGFFTSGKLKRVSASGGPVEVLCDVQDPRGGSWGRAGFILFAPLPAGPLCKISAVGGPITKVLEPDSTRHETALRWPEFLPDGKHFLFVSLPPHGEDLDIYAGCLDSRQRTKVVTSSAAPVCAGKDGLILMSNGHLMSQRFDFDRLSPIGEPRSLGSATASNMSVGQRFASASHTGVLTRTMAALVNTKLVWLDRKGSAQGTLNVPEGRYEQMVFSPDGERIAVQRRTSPTAVDLFIVDIEQESMARCSFGKQSRIGGHPAWSPDGSRIAFSSNRMGPTNIYGKTTRGTEEEELLYQSSSQFKEVDTWSPDGRYILFEQADPNTRWDLWLLPLAGDRKPVPFLRTSFEELFGNVSPDGRWIAYTSDASGMLSLHVQSFPTPSEDHPVMTTLGLYGFWTRDGKQLLVVSPGLDPSIWSVPVTIGASFKAGSPQFLFQAPKDAVWVAPAPDGDRFLASIPVADPIQSTIIVDVNWPAAMAR